MACLCSHNKLFECFRVSRQSRKVANYWLFVKRKLRWARLLRMKFCRGLLKNAGAQNTTCLLIAVNYPTLTDGASRFIRKYLLPHQGSIGISFFRASPLRSIGKVLLDKHLIQENYINLSLALIPYLTKGDFPRAELNQTRNAQRHIVSIL